MGLVASQFPPGWGGKRKGAGRKPVGRANVAHRERAAQVGRHPVHLTLRRAGGPPSLRGRGVFPHVRAALEAPSSTVFRVIHYSVQVDHVHLIVEADDREALLRGASGLAIRVAKAVNRALGRKGRVWGDRYHAHELRSPRETRNAICYVLNNHAKHFGGQRIDFCSSEAQNGKVPSAQTWLAIKPLQSVMQLQ